MKTAKKLLSVLLLAAILCTLLVPVAGAENTLSERQKAIVETAKAFYYKGVPMQYDSEVITELGKWDEGIMRELNYIAPEEGTKDRNIYTVCSSFCFEVIYNAIGYKMMGNALGCTTTKLFENPPEGMTVVYHNNDEDHAGTAAAIQEFKEKIQPGDVVVRIASGRESGHAMMYVGDAFGDGKDYIIHSAGGKYDILTGVDTVEKDGNIRRDTTDAYYYNENGGMSLSKCSGFLILRPLLVAKEAEYPITPAAKARIQYPCLRIDRTVTGGYYGSVVSGGTLTYSQDITNYSADDYKAIPVKELVPSGTELISGSVVGGGTASGSSISWTVDVPAGQTVTLSYEVKVTAKRGELITSKGGSVSTIPSNVLITSVMSGAVDEDMFKNTSNYLSKITASTDAIKFINSAYSAILGADMTLPTMKEIISGMFTEEKKTRIVYWLKDASECTGAVKTVREMLIPEWFGGTKVLTKSSDDRVLQTRLSDLIPGDIIIATSIPATNSRTKAYIRTNDGILTVENKKVVELTDNAAEKAITALLTNNLFIGLRPALALDELKEATQQAAAEIKLTFTDVSENDWFYTYVRDLVSDGTVSGISDTKFAPKNNLTYGQALKLITFAVGKGEQSPLSGGHWASGYYRLASREGWLDGSIDLNANITRLQFCQIAAKAKDLTAQPASNPFTDCNDVCVLALNNAGVIAGMTENTFAPDNLLTRAQITKIIWGLKKL